MIKNLLILFLILTIKLFPQDEPVRTYYSSGKVESEIYYKDNIREGEAKFYYENGNIKEERNYVNGRVEGLVKFYFYYF
jgi:antitoxin component YwqK of YwqJK toxin-antitoxin module